MTDTSNALNQPLSSFHAIYTPCKQDLGVYIGTTGSVVPYSS